MTYQPIVPLSGYTGWRFLQRTLPAQKEAFQESATVKRDVENFREKIGSVLSAAELVEDYDLLRVALGAFGLQDEIGNKYLIEKVLNEGTEDNAALANRMGDSRYADLADAFGFGPDSLFPKMILDSKVDDIVSRYHDRQFEVAVGNVDNDMRLALNVEQGLTDILADDASNTSNWFNLMGNPPLRQVLETAMGFPKSFGAIDLDQQLTHFKDRAQSMFGTDEVEKLAEPENMEKMIRLFLIRSEAAQFSLSNSSAQTALMLLS